MSLTMLTSWLRPLTDWQANRFVRGSCSVLLKWKRQRFSLVCFKWVSTVSWSWVEFLLVFTSHATIFQLYMWRHIPVCAGGLKKKLYLRSGSQRHRHFAGFFGLSLEDEQWVSKARWHLKTFVCPTNGEEWRIMWHKRERNWQEHEECDPNHCCFFSNVPFPLWRM